MPEEMAVWAGVPEPAPQVQFMVDEAKENEFTVLTDTEVADYDVVEMLYMIEGIWRITIEDQDESDELPSLLLGITVDRRYKTEEVRAAVRKLLENLYALEKGL